MLHAGDGIFIMMLELCRKSDWIHQKMRQLVWVNAKLHRNAGAWGSGVWLSERQRGSDNHCFTIMTMKKTVQWQTILTMCCCNLNICVCVCVGSMGPGGSWLDLYPCLHLSSSCDHAWISGQALWRPEDTHIHVCSVTHPLHFHQNICKTHIHTHLHLFIWRTFLQINIQCMYKWMRVYYPDRYLFGGAVHSGVVGLGSLSVHRHTATGHCCIHSSR